LPPVFVLASILTAGAVLRVGARVFLGWGAAAPRGASDVEDSAAREHEDETLTGCDHTPAPMIVVPAILLAAAAALGAVPGVVPSIERAAAEFVNHGAYLAWVLRGSSFSQARVASTRLAAGDFVWAALTMLGALGVGALGLFGRNLYDRVPGAVLERSRGALRGLRDLQSGHVGDYVAWWTAAASLLGGVCLLALS
jgi:multicomponent Na+:H+ antiporter subunit D